MKFRCLILSVLLLLFFITVTPAWANDAPVQAESITDTLNSSVYVVTLVSEEVDRKQLTARLSPLISASALLTYRYIKSVADSTDTLYEKVLISLIREDPGRMTTGYVINEGSATIFKAIKGAQPRIVMRC